MTTSHPLIEKVKRPLRPLVSAIRRRARQARHRQALDQLQRDLGRPLVTASPESGPAEVWAELDRLAPPAVVRRIIPIDAQPETLGGGAYWSRYRANYQGFSQEREKALEHALTFALLDFRRVRRYCDVASARSPIGLALAAEWPDVEYWKQDLLYTTDLDRRLIGGFAQHMQGVEPGSFDALTLHCSFEHFSGPADTEFVAEVDRVLSPVGACLILPLYVGLRHRVRFDPTAVTIDQVRAYDPEADLVPCQNYLQEHCRQYSPATLTERVLSRIPPTLSATLIRFTGLDSIDPGLYLDFALVLHRPDSVFQAP